MEKLMFHDPETGDRIEVYVLEQTCIGGVTYLLCAQNEEEDSEAYILKEIQTDENDVIYTFVEDDVELEALSKVFAEMLDDIHFEC